MKKLVIFATVLLSSSSLFSATILVPADRPTVRAGIDASVNGGTVLVADGTHAGFANRDICYGGIQ